ncbi:glycine-rich cell wall structural protein 1.8-like [Hibiscus syriacus]|uniref:glycine-rich cell wall structural protein 1.8-like n=1 Tax=Hibiscus syriacus TaxID=106335 RepID=UPI001921666A|nr:glycine-rich cell wall structural protein 1.8-like [Hibiscus syriacus]
MASLQCHKTAEKGMGQGYYGGGSSWGSQSNQYQNGYSMSYSEHERHAQIRCPTYGMSESHTAYEYGKSHGTHKHQNGNAMSKPQIHGHGNGYMNAPSQGHGYNHQSGPGKNHGPGYGYGYGHNGTNGHGMPHSPPHHGHGGKLSGHGNGYMKPQAYGHGGNMDYGMTETETREYRSEVYYSNGSHCNSGGRGRLAEKGTQAVKGLVGKIKNGLSGKIRGSDSESDSDDDGRRRRTVCVSKAL